MLAYILENKWISKYLYCKNKCFYLVTLFWGMEIYVHIRFAIRFGLDRLPIIPPFQPHICTRLVVYLHNGCLCRGGTEHSSKQNFIFSCFFLLPFFDGFPCENLQHRKILMYFYFSKSKQKSPFHALKPM